MHNFYQPNSHNVDIRKKIKIFEAFAGIGAQYKALKNISDEMNWEPISSGIIEWFIPAIIGYQAIHYNNDLNRKETFRHIYNISSDSKKPVSEKWVKAHTSDSFIGYWLNRSKEVANNYFDINSVNGKYIDKDIDIFTYSFPCQDISNQGIQKGFDKGSKTRSGLLWEIGRILKEIGKKNLPKYLLLENVKAIFDSNHINTYEEWEKELDKLGYVSKRYILNSRDFGSSQNRERAFVISVLKTHMKKTGFTFPSFQKKDFNTPLKDILVGSKKFNDKYSKYTITKKGKNKNNVCKYELNDYTKFNSENFVYDINFSGPTLTASGALSRIKLYYGEGKIREMLPIECFKYMGFDEADYIKVNETGLISDSKKIFLCGNSISIEVLESIFRSFKF